jgi:hypothetical protein
MAGNNSATNTPMMAITTSSSTRVKPRPLGLVTICHLLDEGNNEEKMRRLFRLGSPQMGSRTSDAFNLMGRERAVKPELPALA